MSEHADHGCPHVELAVGWALHALEPAEESLLLAHLPHCAECTRAVADTEAVGAALGASLPQVEPSPDLERRIMAAAGREAGDGPVPVPSSLPTPSSLHAPRRGGGATRPLPRVLAAAAAIVLLAGSVALGVRVVQLEHEREQAVERYVAISDAIARAAQPGVSRVALTTPDGRGVGMMLAGSRGVEFVATGLARNDPGDQIYVLWGLRGETPVALGGFDVSPDGPVVHPVSSSGGARAFSGYAVSLERGRELPRAPTQVLASGQVES